MTVTQSEEASSDRPDADRAQPPDDLQKPSEETDLSRTGKGSGASGGGSLGNLPGEPMTGGSPEFGPREIQPQDPARPREPSSENAPGVEESKDSQDSGAQR